MKFDELNEIVRNECIAKSIYNNMLSGSPVFIRGLMGSLKTLFLSNIYENTGKPVLSIFPERDEAEWVAEELVSILEEEIVGFFPGGEGDEIGPATLNPRKTGLQMSVIRDLLLGKLKLVTTSTEGILLPLIHPETIGNSLIQLSLGSQYSLYSLLEKLLDYGYVRESMVERPGEISLRGGIFDIFPFSGEEPHRFEFYNDQVESIRTFDVASQRSTGKAQTLILLPVPIGNSETDTSLFSYFSSDRIVFIEDPELILAEVKKIVNKGRKHIVKSEQIKIWMDEAKRIDHYTFNIPDGALDFGGKTLTAPGKTHHEIRGFLERQIEENYEVIVFCQNSDQKQRVTSFLELNDDNMSRIQIEIGAIQHGFSLPNVLTTVYSESDLLGKIIRKRKERFKEGLPIRELASLEIGDYVVHMDFGIGRYFGLEKISVSGIERECLGIEYQDKDKLYVPVDKMQRVQKYAGRDGAQPSLNKLGGNQWEKTKSKTKASIKNIARDLIAVYSARQVLPGHAFAPDTSWQREMEAGFPYEETPDQAKAIEDVKNDLCKPKPMDRLVCGDVGYGKTEVAVRAAFKVIQDGKQAAMLVPTTILAQQHFRTFLERLSSYPCSVEMLSRFRSQQEQRKIIEKLQLGKVDIVIGTHRLFSKDVVFKDLGLLIIDEEHRFGVKHKERLKAFRKTMDVLTLTATPIPRTLYLSLSRIRDMSLINTPPKDRLPIITEVLPFSEEVAEAAIRRELERGGQIFFVHNRVQSIYAVEKMIQRIVPGIRTAVAHGQMHEHDLERVMLNFTDGKYDCLVATMIIESGLDLPHVNTMLINRADRFGLAQLYQLRGRVGRSEKRAFAYLFTPPFQLLTSEAVQRLRTIEEFTELGSGFQIAMRDLEIRGAGNLLGVEQSGNMNAVGYDLYMKLVEEAVLEIKQESEGKSLRETVFPECQIEMDKDAFLSEKYVPDENLRVNLYKRLSMFQSVVEIDGFSRELSDRFGRIPIEAENLMDMARLKIMGQEKGLKRIAVHQNRLELWFDENWVNRFSSQEQFSRRLRKMIDSISVPFQFQQKKGFGLKIQIPEGDSLVFSKKFLQSTV